MLINLRAEELENLFDLYLSQIFGDLDIFGIKYTIHSILKTLDPERYDELFYIWFVDMRESGIIIEEGG